MEQPLHIMIIGAHPDDNELNCGGLTARLTNRGHKVRYVSVTNGDKGHFAADYLDKPALLAERRLIEAQNAAAAVGASLTLVTLTARRTSCSSKTSVAICASCAS